MGNCGRMMDDLVKRLRVLADCDSRSGEPLGKAMREAAAALEAKDAEIARLRALLEDLTGEAENDTETPYFKVALFNARAALQAKE